MGRGLLTEVILNLRDGQLQFLPGWIIFRSAVGDRDQLNGNHRDQVAFRVGVTVFVVPRGDNTEQKPEDYFLFRRALFRQTARRLRAIIETRTALRYPWNSGGG